MAKPPRTPKGLEPGTMLNIDHVEAQFGHKASTVIDHIHKDRKGKLF